MEAGEEEAAKAAAAAGGGSRVTRIHVGGLSASVTAADIEKTFSPLGRITGVDFVRTNGRSFAFMNFEPTSDRHLARLFSTYNGCIWKGGKLKLEKAKEHYFTRLKREWVEDAKLMPTTPINPIAEKSAGHSKRSELLKQENMQLRILFPKLMKVKSLPFKGTGKHKYSFQRIEVPSLPIHFCDCEEHWDPSEMACEKYLSSLNKVIHEKELHIMDSVMNKLFEKEDSGTATEGMIKSARDASISDTLIDDIRFEEAEEAQGTDADNLVTNIGMGGSDDMLMQLKGGEALSVDPESRYGKLQPLKDGWTQNKANSRKRKKSGATGASEVTPNKRAHPISADKITDDEFTAILSRNISSIGRSQEPEIFAEALPVKSQTEPNIDTIQSRKGNSWLQKSSWKDLVGKTGNSSFSFSNVLPGDNSMTSKMVKTSDSAIAISTTAKKRKAQSDGEKSKCVPLMQNNFLENAVELRHVEKSEEGDGIQANMEGGCREAWEIDDAEPRRTGAPTDASAVRPNKGGHPKSAEKITEDEFTPILSCNVSSEGHSQESEVFAEAAPVKSQTELNTDTVQSRKNNSWLQKSSWKGLVGETGNSSFSISNVLPGINSMAPMLAKTSDSVIAISTAAKNRKAESDGEKSNSMQVMQSMPQEKAVEPRSHVEKSKKEDEIRANPEEGGHREEAQGNGDAEPRRTITKVGTSEVCTFMRSAESEKEWARAKAALSGYINKKSIEKDTSKNLKGMPSRKR